MIRITEKEVQKFEIDHIAKVREIAPECTLFLKREEGEFPVDPCKIALYGSGARKTVKGGTDSGDVNVRHFTTIEEGIKNAGFTITSDAWLNAYDNLRVEARKEFIAQVKAEAAQLGVNAVWYGMGKEMPEPEYTFDLNVEGNVAIYVLSRNSGEGSDRQKKQGDIDLTETEIRDIKACQEKYEKFMLVLNVGGMVNLEPVMDVKNILLLGQLGTPTGDVLADILTGKSNPSGKLAMTWAPIDSYPSTNGFGDMDDTIYTEDIYVGYRYFDTAGVSPTFPFGYGLSYTRFEIGRVKMQVNGSVISAHVDVKNIGSTSGKEVVQMYVSSPAGKLQKVYQELAAFAKTELLEAGKTGNVELTFDLKDLSSYDEERAAYILEAGEYIVRVGNNSRDTSVCGVLQMDEEVVVRKCKNICKLEDGVNPDFLKLPMREKQEELNTMPVYKISANSIETEVVSYKETEEEIPKGSSCNWSDVKSGRASVEDYVGNLSVEQLVHLCIGYYEENAGMGSVIGSSAVTVAGAAGETTGHLVELKLPSVVVADGPAGIRVCREYKIVGGKTKAIGNALESMLEFMEPEELQQMTAMAPEPSEEELAAPVHYMYCTAIPIGTALAQTFNVKACEELGNLVGKEMEMFGIGIWLAPAMNIQRSPLCGRDYEYYSEDPVVSGKISAAITKGVQSHPGCGTTIKHYALNNQETNRTASNSIVSERAMREIYLRNFEHSIKECAPLAVMSSYNLVNGVHTNNSREIQNDVLRNEWGYDGLVMTDWYAVGNMLSLASTRKNKHENGLASGCIYAGNDLIMPGMKDDYEDIMQAIDNREAKYPLTKAELQTTAKRVLKLILEISSR